MIEKPKTAVRFLGIFMQIASYSLPMLMLVLGLEFRVLNAVEAPIPLHPGTRHEDGPQLQDRQVNFQWQSVRAATEYAISVRNLTTGDLISPVRVDGEQTNIQIHLPSGTAFRWNLRAFIATNASEFSETLHFQLPPETVHPSIEMLTPNPMPAIDQQQAFTIYGDNFLPGCTVIFRDLDAGQDYYGSILQQRINLLILHPNLTRTEAHWSVEVINPGGYRSGPVYFSTVTLPRINAWQWWRSGWPWAIAGGVLLLVCLARLARSRRMLEVKIDARSYKAARREREKMCRDLHDGISGNLSLVSQGVEKSRILIDRGESNKELSPVLNEIQFASMNAADAVDDILWASEARNERLGAFLARLRTRIADRLRPKEIDCKLDFPLAGLDATIPGAVSQRLLYLTNEVLNNILKHSEAGKVTAKFQIDQGGVHLSISDDGCGFDVDAPNGGRGLKNLLARTKDARGELTISSRLGEGTQVQMMLPLLSETTADYPRSPVIGEERIYA